MLKKFLLVCGLSAFWAFTALCPVNLRAQDVDLKGQISSWGSALRVNEQWTGNIAFRYIPQFNFNFDLNESDILNAELLLNTYYHTDFRSDVHDLKFYRAILRYSTAQSETQLGLQKINFGPAQILRPLMWFDTVDPGDPLKFTEGVTALRYKYNFADNSMLWLWGLYGNKGTKGYELFKTAEKTAEFGARLQLPALSGEVAASFHTRKADPGSFQYRENRYALDGRWDVGIGLWFESAFQQNKTPDNLIAQNINTPETKGFKIYNWNKMITVGADYTFPLANGIYMLAEHMQANASDQLWNNVNNNSLSALMASYPVSVLDNVMLIEYYSWKEKKLYQFCQWQRTYDSFIISLSLFHYPESAGRMISHSKNMPQRGLGLQAMLIYNY